MASIVYNSFLADVFNGNCNTTHTYKAMLVASTYTESRSAHTKRSNITNEITGTNYTSGGVTVALSVTTDNSGNSMTLTIGSATYTNLTATLRKMIVYRSRGGVATADELVCCVDRGSDLTLSATTLIWPSSTWLIPMPAPI